MVDALADEFWPQCPRCGAVAVDYQEHVFWGYGCKVEELPDKSLDNPYWWE